ncbi:MAG: MarR family transcriptional regulator [Candidatus Cloacimonetes bacterium]|nr:MarR family transcriptional regulator [Candidatus Cloacimonadota bacterium]
MQNYSGKFQELLTRLQVVMTEIDYTQKACIQAGKMECQLLNYLYQVKKQANMNELAKALAVSHSRVTRIMDNLVAKSLVTRRPSEVDRRCWYAEITIKGAKLAENSQQTIVDQQQKIVKKLPKNQLEAIYKAFTAYVEAYEQILHESYVEI